MHKVTVYFKSADDAEWFHRTVAKSLTSKVRLAPLYAGIMQDAATRAEDAVLNMDTPACGDYGSCPL